MMPTIRKISAMEILDSRGNPTVRVFCDLDNGPGGWINRNVLLFGLTSHLSDFCHEMATAILPQFMQVIGALAAAPGFIEGLADALSSFVKLGAGYHSDRIGHRKIWTAIGFSNPCG